MDKHFVGGVCTALLLLGTATSAWANGVTERVSVRAAMVQGDSFSGDRATISADGRFVAFYSIAANLVPHDANGGIGDIFVRDRKFKKTTLVNVNAAGEQANGDIGSPQVAISAHGRFVAFSSNASNLVAGDTNGRYDVFVHDRDTGENTRASVDSAGLQSNGTSYVLGLSSTGRFVLFGSYADNLVRADTNLKVDVFVHDRQYRRTKRVSVATSGIQGDGDSDFAAISADGRFVAFHSYATNLVAGETNDTVNVFVHDRQTGATDSINGESDAIDGNGLAGLPAISADGRFVAFASDSTNLVPGDVNGHLDVFVYDRKTAKNQLVSIASDDSQGNGDTSGSYAPSLSVNGRFVAFTASASNLVSNDTNGTDDVFVHDRRTGVTRRVSVGLGAKQGNAASYSSALSADGSLVAFTSDASNLVPKDTNEASDVFVRAR